MLCPRCTHDNRAGARFCEQCAAPLMESHGAERRHLAVVFADLVGSTELSQRLDPEDLRNLLGAYHQVVRTAIDRYGGHVAMLLGDGVISYFGFPSAQEHDVERAVRAGLAIVAGVQELAGGLQVRVGVHAGEVVVGQADGLGADIFGDTPNVTARLQGIAPPNGVVISGPTQRLVQGLFRVEELGLHTLRGVDRPIGVYRVLSPSGVRSRLDIAGDALTPFVGRAAQVATLAEAWEAARTGSGRAVVISGEAGIGKSRLVHALRARLAEVPHTWLECAGSPYTQDSPFHPVIEMQASGLGFVPDDAPEQKLAKLENALERAGFALPDVIPLFARLHGIPLPPRYAHALPLPGRFASIGLTPDAIRRKTKEAARDWLLRMGGQQPVVLFMEDLHWIDPSTIELVGEILSGLADTRVLLIVTHRPSLALPWALPSHASTIALDRLPSGEAARLVSNAAAGTALPEPWVEEIVAKADGVPLFLEEMTKAALEAGGDRPRLNVPATLKGLLMARLDQLGPAREVAQLGAVLGREFSIDLLRALWQSDEDGLQAALERLAGAELLYRIGDRPNERYAFKHALVQDAAYESLLKSERQSVHERIGDVLEARFPGLADVQPELLAHHFTEAQRPERAIPYWYRAAESGLTRSTNVEAIRHLQRGLGCVEQLPDGPARDAIELGFRIQLLANLTAVKGYAAPEMEEAGGRARTLCSALGESPDIFPVLSGLWRFHLVRADRGTTRDLSDQMLALATHVNEPEFLCQAHTLASITTYWEGRFADAREHARAARDIFSPAIRKLELYADDAETYTFIYDSMALWFLGRADEALECMRTGLAVAERVGYAHTVAGALSFTTQLRQLAGDVAATRELSERAIAFSTEQAFPLWVAIALVHHGWVRMREGDLAGGVAEIEQGIALDRATGAMLNRDYFLSLLAEAQLASGARAAGLGTLAEAFAHAEKHLAGYYVPELHRLQGDLLLLAPADPNAAEAAYRRAVALADRLGSPFLGLRARVSLARLRAARGDVGEARRLMTDRSPLGAPVDRAQAAGLLATLNEGLEGAGV